MAEIEDFSLDVETAPRQVKAKHPLRHLMALAAQPESMLDRLDQCLGSATQ
jgi:hypothetical protein